MILPLSVSAGKGFKPTVLPKGANNEVSATAVKIRYSPGKISRLGKNEF